MDSLDLHGIRHGDAKKATIRFIEDLWGSGTYAEIITGHSPEMRKLVIEVLEQYKLEYFVGGYLGTNPAVITVEID